MRTPDLPGDMVLEGDERKLRGGGEMGRERLVRPREVARQLAVSRSTVYRWFWEGRLKGVKLNGGTLRILESAVLEKLAEAD
jgi:excisionase family DNA binding protein